MHKLINGKWKKVKEEPKIKYITKNELKKGRGWSEKMIKLFYPIPDKQIENNTYVTEHKIKLYDLEKVMEVEKTENFSKYIDDNINRRIGSEKAVITKKKIILDDVKKIEISIPIIEKNKLIAESLYYYNCRQLLIGGRILANENLDLRLLKIIAKNFIRHELTDYQIHLKTIYKRVGRLEAFKILKENFNNSIIEAYPWLQ